jgi:hypothetical protein
VPKSFLRRYPLLAINLFVNACGIRRIAERADYCLFSYQR